MVEEKEKEKEKETVKEEKEKEKEKIFEERSEGSQGSEWMRSRKMLEAQKVSLKIGGC